MPIVARISGAEIGGHVERAGVEPRLAKVFAASGDDKRVFVVPGSVVRNLERAKIVPPPPNTRYNVAELDEKLRSAGLDLQQRLETKTALEGCGLL